MDSHKLKAKTFRSRDETGKNAKILYSQLSEKSNSYRINNVDYSVCSRESITTVSRELYAVGYTAMNFQSVGWRIDSELEGAKFYSKIGKDPILIRETNTKWGVVITLLGSRLPIFHDALEALDSLITKKRMLTIMHPVQGTSGLALMCDLRNEVTAKTYTEVDADGTNHNKLALPKILDEPLKADDVLLSKGFIRKSAAYISMPLGVLVSIQDNMLVIVDTPWA